MGRKIARDGGEAIGLVTKQMRYTLERLVWADDPLLQDIASALASALVALNAAVEFIVANFSGQTPRVLAGAVPFLELFGTVAGGWQMARSALVAHEQLKSGSTETDFYRGKLMTARFYAEHLLPRAEGLSRVVIQGGDAVLAMEDTLF
ncbi:hypothetical protein D9M69_626140 [compost metagenome]